MSTLKVDVLPPITLSLGIWKVSESTRPGTALPDWLNQAAISGIFNRVNKVFRQACIIFQPVTGGPDVDAQYDKYITLSAPGSGGTPDIPPNNRLDLFERDIQQNTWVENLAVQQAVRAANAAHTNIALLKFISVGSGSTPVFGHPISFLPTGPTFYVTSGQVARFELGCAHEVAHQFQLSTRLGTENPPQNHDNGPYPKDSTGKEWLGLMNGDPNTIRTEWMRHEDWKKANEIAQEKSNQGPAWTPFNE